MGVFHIFKIVQSRKTSNTLKGNKNNTGEHV